MEEQRIITDNSMGKGDRKTKRGKIWRRSYGKSRPKPKKQSGPLAKAD